jgi:hypothetical protein
VKKANASLSSPAHPTGLQDIPPEELCGDGKKQLGIRTARMDNRPPSPPVVGSRVEVLGEAELFAAEVVKCHSTVEYGMVCEKDGTGGTLVTHEEHRLLPLEKGGGAAAAQKKPAGPKKRMCTIEGCTKQFKARGACIKHGAFGMCLIRDCTTMAVNKTQRCSKHGAKGLCTVPGCATNAKARGLCTKHGGDARAVCVHPGCNTKANARKLCVKHGGSTKDVCVHPGCTTKAQG